MLPDGDRRGAACRVREVERPAAGDIASGPVRSGAPVAAAGIGPSTSRRGNYAGHRDDFLGVRRVAQRDAIGRCASRNRGIGKREVNAQAA